MAIYRGNTGDFQGLNRQTDTGTDTHLSTLYCRNHYFEIRSYHIDLTMQYIYANMTVFNLVNVHECEHNNQMLIYFDMRYAWLFSHYLKTDAYI